MSLVVFIPTFQRPEALQWSLQSVLLQDTHQIDPNEELRIVILNNDISTIQLVEDAVKKSLDILGENCFNNISIVHRNPQLLGVLNFYNGISENTTEGDIAILHGDDDIMLQGSLVKRYIVAKESMSSFNISKTSGKIYLFKNDRNIYLSSKEALIGKDISPKWHWTSKDDLVDYSLPFVSAYCYKIGPEFWSCYNQAKKWADDLPLEPKIRLPFLPFYIGLSAWINKQLVVIPEELVLRGQLLQSRGIFPPRIVTEYANTGIILQTGLAVLNNEDLGSIMELDDLRASIRRFAAEYLFFSLFKRDGVSFSQLKHLYHLSKIRWWSRELLFSIMFSTPSKIIKNVCGLRHLRNRLSGWGHQLSPEDFWAIWAGSYKRQDQ